MCHVWTYWLMKNMFFQARASVDSLKAWKLSHLPLLTALNSELTVQRENLFYHLGEEWKGLVIWKLPPSTGKRSSPSTVFQMSSFVMVCSRVWPICHYIACLNLFVCLVYSVLLQQSCDCSLVWISEPAGLQSLLKVELKLSRGCIKNEETKPSPLLCSVLQALAIQGALQHKIILFSKSQNQHCVQQGCSLIINSHSFVLHYLPISWYLLSVYFYWICFCVPQVKCCWSPCWSHWWSTLLCLWSWWSSRMKEWCWPCSVWRRAVRKSPHRRRFTTNYSWCSGRCMHTF